MEKHSQTNSTLPNPLYINVPNRESLIQTIVDSLHNKKNYWIFLDNAFLENTNHYFSGNHTVLNFEDNSSIEIFGTTRCPWRKYCCPWHEVINVHSNDFIFEKCEKPVYCLFFKLVVEDT